ncbi:hypothetical protein QQZ08_009644 [Neonectria magnoliae]|uniref:SCP domain-containing protein n=1 Tax=Neonectria magnoliae TaxID=2732573 RepID=A0ABR1HNN7_9HYPO
MHFSSFAVFAVATLVTGTVAHLPEEAVLHGLVAWDVPATVPTTFAKQTASASVNEKPVAATPLAALSFGLTADQQVALIAHNVARAEVGVKALTWDTKLAANAQKWATHLTTLGTLKHADVNDQGENLYMQSGTKTPYANATTMWIAEKSSYSGQAIDDNFAIYGHYTQIVWSSTTKVGMAIATGSNGYTYVVARYSPPGN